MPSNTIDLQFADGVYTFALPLVRINELETKCGAPGPPIGIGAIFARVLKGCVNVGDETMLAPGMAEFHAVDLIETIRQGLIGGNHGVVNGEEIKVTPALAERLLQNYVLDRPLNDSWSLAGAILGACIMGYDPPKKDGPPKAGAETGASTTD